MNSDLSLDVDNDLSLDVDPESVTVTADSNSMRLAGTEICPSIAIGKCRVLLSLIFLVSEAQLFVYFI